MTEAEIREDERRKIAAFVAGYGSAFLRLNSEKSASDLCTEIVAAILGWDRPFEEKGRE